MNLSSVKQLVELLEGSGLGSLTYEDNEFKLSLSKQTDAHEEFRQKSSPQFSHDSAAVVRPESTVQPGDGKKLVMVTSPVVGTAYRAREPGKAPIVSVGDTVAEGGALCVIEAMKIFSEIPSPCAGTVVEIVFTDGQLAEFGTKLIVIEAAQ